MKSGPEGGGPFSKRPSGRVFGCRTLSSSRRSRKNDGPAENSGKSAQLAARNPGSGKFTYWYMINLTFVKNINYNYNVDLYEMK
jgi:hypothetical protein